MLPRTVFIHFSHKAKAAVLVFVFIVLALNFSHSSLKSCNCGN